jgi:DNA invertase Pin-like site-specific DNA recombinase
MMAKGRGRKATGERVGNSKLKEDQVKEIRMLVAGGMKQTEVAAKFGVHSSWVSRISRNEFWRDI